MGLPGPAAAANTTGIWSTSATSLPSVPTYTGPLGDNGPPAKVSHSWPLIKVSTSPPPPDVAVPPFPKCVVTGSQTVTVSNGSMIYLYLTGDSCMSYSVQSTLPVSVAMMESTYYTNWAVNNMVSGQGGGLEVALSQRLSAPANPSHCLSLEGDGPPP